MTAIDEVALARCAREALANAQGGTLHIDGVDVSGGATPGPARLANPDDAIGPDSDALFYDEDGRPTFLCAPDSAVCEAAVDQRLAVLSVPAPRDETAARLSMHAVILAGHLTVVGEEDVHGELVSIVGLQIGSVVIEHLDPDGPGVIPRTLPLAAWTAAAPDPVAEAATRMVEHTNRSHSAEVRAFVAGLAAIDEAVVLAAEIDELDGTGFVVDWIDDRGGHRLRVRFPSPARCPASLAARLRETLSD